MENILKAGKATNDSGIDSSKVDDREGGREGRKEGSKGGGWEEEEGSEEKRGGKKEEKLDRNEISRVIRKREEEE